MPETQGTTEDRLAEAFLRAHPDVAARAVERMSRSSILDLCNRMPAQVMAPVIAQMDQRQALAALTELDRDRAAGVVGALDPSFAGLLLRRLPEATREEILQRVPVRRATPLRDVLRYPAESAAALCDPGVLTVFGDRTVSDAIEAVRQAGRAYYYVFVVDRGQRLTGVVNLRDLLLASAATSLASIARADVARLQGTADPSTILAHPSWRSLHALPVVDAGGRFLGLLRHETLKRLEAENSGASAGQAAATLAVEFGELLWSAGSVVVGELADAIAPGASGSPGVTR